MTPSLISVDWLRRVVGVLGISLPFALFAIAGQQESISAYYHTAARDVFVGWLTLIAGCLAAYRGYDSADKWCARIAATGLLVVAYAPTGDDLAGKAHLAGALVFFASVAVLCDRFGKGSRPNTFRLMALGIVAAVIWALVAGIRGGSIYFPEALAVVLFGEAWLLKGRLWKRAQ